MAKRERILALGVGAVVALYVGDNFILEPFLDQQKVLAEMRIKDRKEAKDAEPEQYRESRLRTSIQALPTDPKEAERRLLGAINEWANDTGIQMSSVKPEYIDSKKQLREIVVQASGSGRNRSMIHFLYKLHAAKFPLRIIKTQLGTHANDSEDLTLTLRVSTPYLAPEQKKEPVTKKDNAKKVADSH